MSSTYQPTSLPHHLHLSNERCSTIPLDGIPQIPDAADRWWKRWDGELPTALQAECDRAIAAAMAEHRRRRIDKLRASPMCSYSRYRHEDERHDEADDTEELD